MPQRLGGVAPGLRVDLVAPGEGQRFGAQRGGVDPRDGVAVGEARASAISSLPITSAQAPSDDGQVSSNRMGSQSI